MLAHVFHRFKPIPDEEGTETTGTMGGTPVKT